MAKGRCDICGRPATVRAQVTSNGRRRAMELCDEHYRQIARQSRGRSSSPLESLFQRRGSLFDDFSATARSMTTTPGAVGAPRRD